MSALCRWVDPEAVLDLPGFGLLLAAVGLAGKIAGIP
jgi:hypothetical protein